MDGGKKLVAVAEVVLAELARRIALPFGDLGERRISSSACTSKGPSECLPPSECADGPAIRHDGDTRMDDYRKFGHDLGGEALQGLGVGVVGAPRDEAAAAEVDVRLDLLGDLLRRADEVALPPATRPARPTGCASRRRRPPSSVARMNTSGDHVMRIASGSRPTSAQWPRSTSRLCAHCSGLPPKFEQSAWRATTRSVSCSPPPPIHTGGCGSCSGFGSQLARDSS